MVMQGVISIGEQKLQSSTQELLVTGIPQAFLNLDQVVYNSSLDLKNIISDTINNVQNNSFSPAYSQLAWVKIKNSDSIGLINNFTLIVEDLILEMDYLKSNLTILLQLQSQHFINGVPSNTSLPTFNNILNSLNSTLSESLNASLSLNNVENKLNSARSEIGLNSTVVLNLFENINNISINIQSTIKNIQNSYNSLDLIYYYNMSKSYINMENLIRLSVLVITSGLLIIFYGLWYIGIHLKSSCLISAPFTYAKSIIFVFMLVAAVLVMLFIPINDICIQIDPYISIVANKYLGKDYASNLGISNLTITNSINQIISKAVNNPNLILECTGNESLVTQLSINIPTILNLDSLINQATENLTLKAKAFNSTSYLKSIQTFFQKLDTKLDQIQTNITHYNNTYENYQTNLTNISGSVHKSSQNLSNQVQKLLYQVNNITDSKTSPHLAYFTIQNISTLNYTNYPNNSTFLKNAKSEITLLNNVSLTLIQSYNNSLATNTKIGVYIFQISLLLIKSKSESNLIYNTLNNTNVIQNVLDSIYSYLNEATNNILKLAAFPQLGKCSFIGQWYIQGFESGFCSQISTGMGASGISMVILGFVLLFSYPIILGSIQKFTTIKPKNDVWSTEMAGSL